MGWLSLGFLQWGFRGITNEWWRIYCGCYAPYPDELHRAGGHMPYDPNCKHCVAAKSVGQHRRKNKDSEGGVVVELHSDFFFIGKEKFLVVADLSSHMFGALWMSPNGM